jgi:hypothetical protein
LGEERRGEHIIIIDAMVGKMADKRERAECIVDS